MSHNLKRLLVVGSSGHATSVLGVAHAMSAFEVVGLLDDFVAAGTSALGYAIVGGVADAGTLCERLDVGCLFVAIGDNFRRQQASDRLAALLPTIPFVTLVHPSAVIARDASLGAGTVVMPQAVVGPGCRVGAGCVLNTSSSLDHEGVLSDWVSLAPGVTAGGRVRVGARSFIGLGANLIPGISVGSDTVVGAGSLLLSDVGTGVVAYGSPCRAVRERQADEGYL